MQKKCKDCGIAEKIKENNWTCLKYKKNMDDLEAEKVHDCSFFISVRTDGGEQLSTFEHLLLKEQEVNSKRMKGPI